MAISAFSKGNFPIAHNQHRNIQLITYKNPGFISIALVDDDELQRFQLSVQLQSYNYTILFEAIHGRDCIEKLKAQPSLPDVCILDINMPIMNGYETAAELKRTYPAIKIIAYSSLADLASKNKMLSSGACAYFNKSCQVAEIDICIKQLMYNTNIV